jgi:hypothetical protein
MRINLQCYVNLGASQFYQMLESIIVTQSLKIKHYMTVSFILREILCLIFLSEMNSIAPS